MKTVEQRSRYAAMLGSSLVGTAGIRQDVCYHRACDVTSNVNQFTLEKMVQAVAYAIESSGQQQELKS